MTYTAPVTCPSCFEEFEVALPGPHEVPCDVDYDCEICCRPMRIRFEIWDEDEITATAYGLGD
jgi:Cysteine-rich CPXCG